MKLKGKPESKILMKKTNTNKKKTADAQGRTKKFDTSLVRKNEFTLILFGALLLTLIVFFLFFRSPGPEPEAVQMSRSDMSLDLEKRIKTLEQALEGKVALGTTDNNRANTVTNNTLLTDRVTRLETAFSVKFDSLLQRMESLEKKIFLQAGKKVAAVTPDPEKKPVTLIKKTVKKEKKAAMFHRVKKGETLYSISKKYDISVAALQKLNNLSPTAKIFPGDNILIR